MLSMPPISALTLLASPAFDRLGGHPCIVYCWSSVDALIAACASPYIYLCTYMIEYSIHELYIIVLCKRSIAAHCGPGRVFIHRTTPVHQHPCTTGVKNLARSTLCILESLSLKNPCAPAAVHWEMHGPHVQARVHCPAPGRSFGCLPAIGELCMGCRLRWASGLRRPCPCLGRSGPGLAPTSGC